MDRLLAAWPALRDVALFTTGLMLTIYEAVIWSGQERYGLLTLYAGMMGLPAFLRVDERRNKKEPSQPSPEPEQ